jgi:hypothetical protein
MKDCKDSAVGIRESEIEIKDKLLFFSLNKKNEQK